MFRYDCVYFYAYYTFPGVGDPSVLVYVCVCVLETGLWNRSRKVGIGVEV